jgi:uncharacterized protein YbjT (DUF2867 family)
MRIAIVGGAGTLGRHITAELAQRGHDVRVLSRSSKDFPVDLISGQGLTAALDGCGAVVDASNASSPKRAAQVLVQGSGRLLAAEQHAGVRHHVGISTVGCERVSMGYYRVKVEQEHVIEQGPVPWSMVRATQFHELAAAALGAAGRWHVLPVPDMQVQPIAAAEVARAVADVALGEPGRGRIQVAGPQVTTAAALARTWKRITGHRALSVPMPVLGRLGRALRTGGLTAEHADVLGSLRFADWLATQVATGAVLRSPSSALSTYAHHDHEDLACAGDANCTS